MKGKNGYSLGNRRDLGKIVKQSNFAWIPSGRRTRRKPKLH